MDFVSFSSNNNTGSLGNLGGTPNGNNPGMPSGSNQPDNSGSNNRGLSPNPVPDWDTRRREVGVKLRDLFVNRPPRTSIFMTDPTHVDKINA